MFLTPKLKGCPKSTLDDEVSDMISLLHLEDKTNVQSANLSGGMKRKLSVGMALIGGSKVKHHFFLFSIQYVCDIILLEVLNR